MAKRTITTLSEVCSDISYGYTESAHMEKIGPQFLRITDIANGRINWNNVPYCPISSSNYEKYRLSPGDIVIARTGATTGANYTIKNTDPKELVFASYLIRYKIDNKIADPYFVGHLLKSTNWNEYVDAIAGGSAQPGANAKQLGSFEFILPTLPEQKAIASILSSLDDKIDLLHRQNATLEAMAETLFRQWFVEETEDHKIGVLGDVIELHYGKSLKEGLRSQSGYPVVGSSGIVGYHSEFLVESPGIVIGRKGTLGKVNYLFENFYPIDTTYFVKSKVNSEGLFFEYFLLKTMNFTEMNSDSAVPGLNRELALSIEVSIPSRDLIKKFNSMCLSFFNKINLNNNQIRTLSTLRDTLLPRLMKGEIRLIN